MRIEDGDRILFGPLDALFIIWDPTTGRFHPATYEERPLPGPVREIGELEQVRLRSGLVHTKGFATALEAQANFDEMRKRCVFDDRNVCRHPFAGTAEPQVTFIPNWRRGETKTVTEVLREMGAVFYEQVTDYMALKPGEAHERSATGEVAACPKCGLPGLPRTDIHRSPLFLHSETVRDGRRVAVHACDTAEVAAAGGEHAG